MARVFIPAALRKLTEGRDQVIAGGRNVKELIDDLQRQFPGIRDHLVQDDDLKPGLAVSIDGEIATSGLLEPVIESSAVHFLPALGGGHSVSLR